MKQNTGTNMSRPHIWDDAFELVEQFDASEPESAEQINVEVSEPMEPFDTSEPEPVELLDVNEPEPGEQEIAFREITEFAPPDTQVNGTDTFHEREGTPESAHGPYELPEEKGSLKVTPVQHEPHESEVSFRSPDEPDKHTEKEILLRQPAEESDLITIDLETMDFEDGTIKKSAKELYYETLNNLFKSFHLIKDEKDFSIDTVFTYAGDMAAHIKDKANSWMQLLYKIEKDTAPDAVMHIVKHSLDTAIIAIRIGIGLKLRDEKLELLAMQSCLHDVGMLKLPPELILKQGKLPRKEIELIRKHPEYGYEILRNYEGKFRNIAEIAYQVHERYDGSGYPRGKKGKDIPEHSLIIGIADMFAALLHPRPYRPRRLPFEAIKEIIAAAKEQFQKHIIKALVSEFSAFPEGLYVKLNSDEVGKVITVNRLAPLSPVVEILYNAQGKLKETKIVDLMKDHCLYIASGFYGEEE